MIQFKCPRCQHILSSSQAGVRINCPRCNQRLEVPAPPSLPPHDKTVLGSWTSAAIPASPGQPQPPREESYDLIPDDPLEPQPSGGRRKVIGGTEAPVLPPTVPGIEVPPLLLEDNVPLLVPGGQRSISSRLTQKLANAWVFFLVMAAVLVPLLLFFFWPRSDGPSSQDSVVISSQPSGARVFLDDEPQAQPTPAQLRPSAGRHRLRVELAGYETAEQEIEVEAGAGKQMITLLLRAKKLTVHITSTPPHARVVIDDQKQEKTTPADFDLPAGPHRVAVALAGRQLVEREVTVKVGKQRTAVHFELPELPPRYLAFQGSRDPEQTLRRALAKAARSLATFLKGKELDTVSVGEFSGPASIPCSAGPLLAALLMEELQAQGLTVEVPADVGVKGEYTDPQGDRSQLVAVPLLGKVTNRLGNKVLRKFKSVAVGEASVATLLGVTCSLPLKADEQERNDVLLRHIKQPRVSIRGTRVAARPDSPYAIEVLTAPTPDAPYQAANVGEAADLAFVSIKKRQVYAIKVTNDSDHEVAVTLTIDGLNVFAFNRGADGRAKYHLLVVGPKTSTTIRRWYRPGQKAFYFVPTGYPRWRGLDLPNTFGVGTITASFAAAWPRGGNPPADEPNARPWRDRHCHAVQLNGNAVEVARHFGLIRAIVSVRYEK